MSGRELNKKLHYTGMERAIRELAIKDKLIEIDKLASMPELEVCDIIASNYQLVYSEDEEIGLVRNSEAEEVFGRIIVISR